MDFGAIGPVMDAYRQRMEALMNLQFQGAGGTGGVLGPMFRSADALTRIGLFKSGRDSQLQTLRASLEVQRGIQSNTGTVLTDAIINS